MGLANKDIHATGDQVSKDMGKSPECMQKMPGGHCDAASGAPDCTYSYEEAGEVMLDDLVGIEDYNEFWNVSYTKCARERAEGKLDRDTECLHKKEYNTETDKGVGMSFWNGKNDADKCTDRMDAVRALFKVNSPEFLERLPEPACEFDMFYDGEFDWPVNHTKAVAPAHTDWWENRIPTKREEVIMKH